MLGHGKAAEKHKKAFKWSLLYPLNLDHTSWCASLVVPDGESTTKTVL